MDLKETHILADRIANHWYCRSRAKAMTRLLAKAGVSTILDIGAGSGFFSRHLLSQSTAKEARCVDISYDWDSDASEAGKHVHFRRSIDAVNAELVFLMDVLEHVEDDVGLLREYAGKVSHGSGFLISVPAFQFLWSGHDIFLEHKRRYQLTQIEDVGERAGLVVMHGAYYFGGVFPVAACTRIFQNLFSGDAQQPQSQLKHHRSVVNETLAFLCNAELLMMRHNRFAGLTAFCLAKNK